MHVHVIEQPVTALASYADIPSAFEVTEAFDVITEPDGRFQLEARPLAHSYVKSYDTIGKGPSHWAEQFDLSRWGFFSAISGGQCVGRAAVARDTPALDLLDGRRDLALLWDIRVAHSARRHGVGSALFDAAAAWATARGCRQLKIETQNVNVAACHFYARQGCVLGAARPGAYPELPDEIQLVWIRDLTARRFRRSH